MMSVSQTYDHQHRGMIKQTHQMYAKLAASEVNGCDTLSLTCIGDIMFTFSPFVSWFIVFWNLTACCVKCFKHSELSFVRSWSSPSYSRNTSNLIF